MGFSVSGATAVLFVGLLVGAATLYPAVDRYAERRSDATTANNERILTQQNTAIETVNATYNASTDQLTITVRNTGASTLSVVRTDVLVDGSYAQLSASNTTVGASSTTDIWAPGERLTVTLTHPSEPNRVKIVSGPGVAVTAPVEVR
jgi:flagellar protein FlaF